MSAAPPTLENADNIYEPQIEYIPEDEWYQLDPTIQPPRTGILVIMASSAVWLGFFAFIIWLLI